MKPPVTYIPGYLPPKSAENVMFTIWHETHWEQREDAPRREYWINPYGMPYTYGSGVRARTYDGHDWFDSTTGQLAYYILQDRHLGDHVDRHMLPDCCFLNGYIDGHQHLGWHADDSPEMDHAYPILVVSLGAAREIWVRPKGHKGEIPPEWRFMLEPGSLFIMQPGMQRDWYHRIPKADRECGPRVSLTYRRLVEAEVISFGLERAAQR